MKQDLLHLKAPGNWMNDPNGFIFIAVNITCSINTFRMVCSGVRCIGGMRPARIWLNGRIIRSLCFPAKGMIGTVASRARR